MDSEDRKAAVAAYKTRKASAGIFAVRCAASGQTSGQIWIGRTLNLETVQNRIWFSLRVGSHSNAELQSAWAAHGADAFSFEPLEALEEEELDYVRDTLLKERAIHWRTALKGAVI
jgi:hypothetical protein